MPETSASSMPPGVTVHDPASSFDDRIVAGNAAMAAAVAALDRAAVSDQRVFVWGESGVGVGWLCRRAHVRSRRRAGPLVVVNSAAIPESEMEQGLFGARGAVALARKGTLLVRLFAELPRVLQQRLLSCGDDDFRLVATSQRSPHPVLAEFTSCIEIPPLRDRADDIDALVPLLAERIRGERVGTWSPTEGFRDCDVVWHPEPTGDQLALLREHSWPGNVRELYNVLFVAMIHGDPIAKLIHRADASCP